MADSFKKHVIVKDKKPKRWYKVVRNRNKQQVKEFKEPLKEEELINQYDICDWKWILNIYKAFDKKHFSKLKRK